MAFSDLGVLHPPIFQSMAKAIQGAQSQCLFGLFLFRGEVAECNEALLGTWPDPFSASDAAQLARVAWLHGEGSAGSGSDVFWRRFLSCSEVFAVQRFRQEEIFARIAVCLRGGLASMCRP